MQFRILGVLDVIEGDCHLSLRSAKQRALLAILLCQTGKVVHSDVLIDALWGPDAGDLGTKRLRLQLHRLRRVLGATDAIVHKPTGYTLPTAEESVDALQFERLAHEGRKALAMGRDAQASDLFRSALRLWRGRALSGLENTPLLHQEATRLNEERLAAIGDCVDADLRLRRHADLIGELSVLVREHPLQERFRGQLMIALYRAGRQAEALEVFRIGRSILIEDLGLEPSAELRRLELAILTSDASLTTAHSPVMTRPARGRSTRAHGPRCPRY